MERLNRIQDPTLPEEAHIARATSHLRRALTRFRSSVYQPEDGEDGHILAQVWSALANTLLLHDEPFPLRPIRLVDQPGVLYLLFFDGGSRGNTGTGGSGSVIVKVHTPTHTACIVSVASMAYGNPTTTNDFAEYQGLVHGLRRAKKGVLSPLHVVGDSAILLSQLRTYHSPRKLQLAQLYDVAKDLADDVAVVSWGHHYRDYNKMADCVANKTMETCSSVQVRIPSGRKVVKELAAHLYKDVNHWIETSTNEDTDSSGPTYTEKDRIL